MSSRGGRLACPVITAALFRRLAFLDSFTLSISVTLPSTLPSRPHPLHILVLTFAPFPDAPACVFTFPGSGTYIPFFPLPLSSCSCAKRRSWRLLAPARIHVNPEPWEASHVPYFHVRVSLARENGLGLGQRSHQSQRGRGPRPSLSRLLRVLGVLPSKRAGSLVGCSLRFSPNQDRSSLSYPQESASFDCSRVAD